MKEKKISRMVGVVMRMRMMMMTMGFWLGSSKFGSAHLGIQPLSKIAIHKATPALTASASIKVSPFILGFKGEDTEWVSVDLDNSKPSNDDWIGVFSPAKFNDSSTCEDENNQKVVAPFICTAPIKYQYANYSTSNYTSTGKNSIRFQLINQRADFSFALFSGSLSNMTVTWTSGYNTDEAIPLVKWGMKNQSRRYSPAGILTFQRNSMCGAPARTVGWRDPGFIHTAFLKDLWPNTRYSYVVGHRLSNGSYVWSKTYSFTSFPYPGQNSLQRVIIFGDMGKVKQ